MLNSNTRKQSFWMSGVLSLVALTILPFNIGQTAPTQTPLPETPAPEVTAEVTVEPTPDQQLRNDGFLVDDSLINPQVDCESLCWRGIIAGTTSWDDAAVILEAQPDLTEIKFETNDETGEVAVTFQRVGGIPCCLLYSVDGQNVDQMLFQLAPNITLSQVIETHGDPSYVSLTEVDEDQGAAALFYPEKNFVAYAFIVPTGDLTEESEIFAALHLSPEYMDKVFKTSILNAYDGYKSYADYEDDKPVVTPVTPDSSN